MHLRWLTSPKCRILFGLMCLLVFIYTKIDLLINDESPIGQITHDNVGLGIEMASRSNCQIIYIIGVEGSVHHGFTPILHSLALKQQSNEGHPIDVQLQPRALRKYIGGTETSLYLAYPQSLAIFFTRSRCCSLWTLSRKT